MANTYFIVTFGCQANKADSERIAGWYEQRGWQKAKDRKFADEVVFNTCSVRQSAEDRVIGQIYQLGKYKKRKYLKKPKIILTGCMTRFSKTYLMKKMPDVNAIWPIDKFSFALPSVREKKEEALIPIMTGCDNYCTYCVVPFARGREISRPVEEILYEVECLVKQGYKTVMLLGQNVNSYHKNKKLQSEADSPLAKKIQLYQKNYRNNFAVLLALLNDLPGLRKIKFLTSNPQDLSDGIIKALKLPKVDHYLHLPLQSGDNDILQKMNRCYTTKQYLKLVDKIKKTVPDITFGTDIIVGFPGESKAQFNRTVKVCQKVGFVKAYIAKYSPRPQTAACRFTDNVSWAEKKRRWQILDQMINR